MTFLLSVVLLFVSLSVVLTMYWLLRDLLPPSLRFAPSFVLWWEESQRLTKWESCQMCEEWVEPRNRMAYPVRRAENYYEESWDTICPDCFDELHPYIKQQALEYPLNQICTSSR